MTTAAPDDATSRPFSISASFNTAAQWASRQCGRASTFAIAALVVIIWAVTGPFFNYSDTWQLVINTGTTIVTYRDSAVLHLLMVFLIQNTQKMPDGNGSRPRFGLGVRETPIDSSLCAHAILQPDQFVVPDTTKDARICDNPLVTGEPRLRFYAGALLAAAAAK